MKIRTDFVTNSSSTSQVAITIKSSKLMEILAEYKAFLQSVQHGAFHFSEDAFEFTALNESGIKGIDVPENEQKIAGSLKGLFAKILTANAAPDEMREKMLQEIESGEKEINETVSYLEWKCLESVWGGNFPDWDIDENTPEDADSAQRTKWASYDGKRFEYKEEEEYGGAFSEKQGLSR